MVLLIGYTNLWFKYCVYAHIPDTTTIVPGPPKPTPTGLFPKILGIPANHKSFHKVISIDIYCVALHVLQLRHCKILTILACIEQIEWGVDQVSLNLKH